MIELNININEILFTNISKPLQVQIEIQYKRSYHPKKPSIASWAACWSEVDSGSRGVYQVQSVVIPMTPFWKVCKQKIYI